MREGALAGRSNPVTTIVPIEFVHAWKDNPRQVKKGDYDRLKKQILELGFYKALVATQDPEAPGHYIVLGGNTRLRALKELGWTEIGLTIVDAPTEDLKLKYNISDNDNVGAWDDQALAEIAFRVKDQLLDLDAFRIDLARPVPLSRLMDGFGPSQDPEDDPIPTIQADPVTKPGDLFTLGPHKLLCGDATKPESYTRLLEGSSADLVFTDPPGIDLNTKPDDAFIEFCELSWSMIKLAMKEGAAFYACTELGAFSAILYALKKNALVIGGLVVWIRNRSFQGGLDYKRQHDLVIPGRKKARSASPILYGWREGRHYFFDYGDHLDVWEDGPRARSSQARPGGKPLALIQRAIKASSKPGELVLDPFAGSGSTLIAADREGRRAALIELEPASCDVIIRRWAAQGLQTEAEIRDTVQRPPDLGPARAAARRTPRGKGHGQGQA